MRADYAAFLASKRPAAAPAGLAVMPPLLPALKPHQADCVAFGLRQGLWACLILVNLIGSL